MEAALSHAIKLEAFEQSLAYQDTLIGHDDGRAMRRPRTVCAVTGPSEACKPTTLCKLIETEATSGMAALATGIWSGRATLSDAASSVSSIPGTVSMRQHRHLDTWPQVSQVVEVAMDARSSAFERDGSVPHLWTGRASG